MHLSSTPLWWQNPARDAVVRPQHVGTAEGPTPGEARGRRWRRTASNGFYVPAEVALGPEQRIVEASPLLTDAFAGITGWAGLRWLGGVWFDGTSTTGEFLDVPIVTGLARRRSRAGVHFSEERLSWPELVVVDGVSVTTPVRSVAYAMRMARSVWDAVCVFDMAAYNDLVSLTEVATFLDLHQNGWTGVPQAREALRLCDENAWSPTEVALRRVWTVDAGLPRPLTNLPIFDLRGRLLGVPDVVDPVAGVFGEYDGALHLAGERRSRDVVREAQFRAHGLEGVTMMAGDLPNPWSFVRRLREAYDRAPRNRRLWTTKPPAWWVGTESVDQRRALSSEQRGRLLRIRYRPEAA